MYSKCKWIGLCRSNTFEAVSVDTTPHLFYSEGNWSGMCSLPSVYICGCYLFVASFSASISFSYLITFPHITVMKGPFHHIFSPSNKEFFQQVKSWPCIISWNQQISNGSRRWSRNTLTAVCFHISKLINPLKCCLICKTSLTEPS